eukprot:jgi/Bigna1/90095/estExt_fgenesh1_pg.C_620030
MSSTASSETSSTRKRKHRDAAWEKLDDNNDEKRKIGKGGSGSNKNQEMEEESEAAMSALASISNEIDNLNAEASEEISKIEAKYEAMSLPLLTKQARLVGRIPLFWKRIFQNHELLSTNLEEIDEQILIALRTILVEDIESKEGGGYKITFEFNAESNTFFKENIFQKSFTENDNGEIVRVENGQITWINSKVPLDYPDSFFVTWFSEQTSTSPLIVESIRSQLWVDPLTLYLDAETAEEGSDIDDEEMPELVTILTENETTDTSNMSKI